MHWVSDPGFQSDWEGLKAVLVGGVIFKSGFQSEWERLNAVLAGSAIYKR